MKFHLLAIALILAAATGGCVKTRSGAGATVYSSDSSRRAYAAIKEKSVAQGPMDYRGSLNWVTTRKVYVQWRSKYGMPHKVHLDLNEPLEEEESLKVDKTLRVVFSPDGRRLAAIARRKIWVIDTDDNSRREITEGLADVVSAGWLSPVMLGFASQTKIDDPSLYAKHRRFDVSFWQCRVDKPSRPELLQRLRMIEHRSPSRNRGRPDEPHHDWRTDGKVADRDSGVILLDISKLPYPVGRSR